MIDFTFTPLDAFSSRRFLKETKEALETASLSRTKVAVVTLPFYESFKLYEVTDALRPMRPRHILYRQENPADLETELISMLDWTNEPIYSVNEAAPIKVNRRTVIPYARFFFHFVWAKSGSFHIVEKPEQVTWLSTATAKEKALVKRWLMPLTYQGLDREGLFTLTATVIFKNALFRTDIKVAPRSMLATDDETGENQELSIGQLKLTNEEPVLENLSVSIKTHPNEHPDLYG